MSKYGLIADVGGTNIRLQLVDLQTAEAGQLKKYLCADYPAIIDVIRQYVVDCGQPEVVRGCIAIACPTNSDWIAMTNHSWAFSKAETQAELGWERLDVINDYTAIAMSLPHLTDTQKVQLGGGQATEMAPIAVYGPGTGLGVAHLIPAGDKWYPMPGEGGHVDFAPIDDVDSHILSFLSKRYAHVSVEQLLSGPGIVQIYEAICDLRNHTPTHDDAAEISQRAIDNGCAICVETLQQFCRILGSFGGNLALTMSTFGGVYVAGGIIPRFIEFVQSSDFRARFDAKGRFEDFNKQIPVYVVTEDQPGLVGAKAFLLQELKSERISEYREEF